MTSRLPGRVRAGYAAGSLATGAFSTVPGLLLLPYLTDTVGVGAALAGVLVLLPKAWDVIFNPIAGRLSDAHAGPRGPRRPFLLYGGLATAVAFAAMFVHPPVGTAGIVTWVVILFLATATAYALFQVPYVALPAEMTDDPAERTRLMTRRIAVLAVAILVAGAGAPAIRDAAGGVAGYRLMGLAIGALIAIGALWSYVGTARAPIGAPLPSAVGYRQTIAAVRAAPRFARLWIVFVIQAVGIGTMLAGVDYVARVVLGRPGASSILFAAFVGPALAVMPLWQLAARRYSKVACYVAASVLFAAGAIGLLIAALPTLGRSCIDVAISGPGGDHGVCSIGGSPAFGWTSYTPLTSDVSLGPPLAVVVALVVAIGIGYAGQQVFPLSLLADLSAEAETETGGKRAGVFAGVWTAGETFGMALGPGIYGVVLALGSYISLPGSPSDSATESVPAMAALLQPQSAAIAIILGFTAIPALCVLAPLVMLKKLSTSHGKGQA
jgi:Na+/melibiose symporter-like transporter